MPLTRRKEPKDVQPELLKAAKSMREILITDHDSLFVIL
jgi:hypothetical protein